MAAGRKETEERLRQAIGSITPDLKEQIMERAVKAQGDAIPLVFPRRRHRDTFMRILTAAAALLLLANIAVFAISGDRVRRVDSVIQLDVNPSIQMEVNRIGRVISARALNEDAQSVIGTMDLSGATTQVAVNAVVGALYQAGYLQQETNSILVSVSGRNAQRSQAVQAEVVSDIGATLNAYAVDASILAQTVTESESLNTQAADYGISAGKALLIDKILAVYPYYTEEELARFTINELNQLLNGDAGMQLADVSVTTVSHAVAEPVLTAASETDGNGNAGAEGTGGAVRDAEPGVSGADAEDGQAPAGWDIMDYAEGDLMPEASVSENEAVSEEGEAGEEDPESGDGKESVVDPRAEDETGSVSENSASMNSVSVNSVSVNSVSVNSVSVNSVSVNSVSANSTE